MIFAFVLSCWAAPPTPDEGRSLLAKAVSAHGGLERFRGLKDWRIVAERSLGDSEGVSEIYEEYFLREGDRERTLLVKKRGESVLVFGHDGAAGFSVSDGAVRADAGAAGEGYYRAHGEYYLRALPFKWMDPGVRVIDAGRESAGGRDLQLLRISAEENVGPAWKDVWVAAIDVATHLLWEARLTHNREMETWMSPRETGTASIIYRYSDYRNVGGLEIPFRLEYFANGRKTGENVIRKIELDSGLAPELFTPDAHSPR